MATSKPAVKSAKPAVKNAAVIPEGTPEVTGGTAVDIVATPSNLNLPAFLQAREGQAARGTEGVGMEDLVIPRLELVQSLSPCLEEGTGAFIDGAKPGMLYNNVTRELYGRMVSVIPVSFKKEYIVWKDRKKGGGFVGAFSTADEADAVMASQEVPGDHRVNDTANQFCLLIHPETGDLIEIVVSMAVTKLKVSRQWNTLIRINGGDSFARVYELGSFLDENKAGEKYHNFTIKNVGYVSELQYKRAEELYEVVSSGAAKMSRDDEVIDVPSREVDGQTEY